MSEDDPTSRMMEDPGPGTYETARSCFGNQTLSHSSSAPAFGIPKTGWMHWNKVLITKNHNDGLPGEGAGSYDPSKEAIWTPLTRPWTFGTSTRVSEPRTKTPGPCYDVLPKRPSTGATIGNAKRFAKLSDIQVGPGEYQHKPQTAGSKSFGTSFRAYQKVWRNQGEENLPIGHESPGPGPPLWHNYGRGSGPIGKDTRFHPSKSEGFPGPGKYNQVFGGTGSPQPIAHVRSVPSLKFCKEPSGHAKRRERLDFKKLRPHQDRIWGYF